MGLTNKSGGQSLLDITRNASNQQLLAQLAALGGPAIYGICVARWLGPSDRGMFVALLAASSIAGLLGTLGIATELRRRTAAKLYVPIGRSTRGVLIAGIVMGLACSVILAVNDPTRYSPRDLACVVGLSALTALTILFRELLFGLGSISKANWFMALANLSQLLPIGVLHFSGVLGLTQVLVVQLMAQTLILGLLASSWYRQTYLCDVGPRSASKFRITRVDRLSLVTLLGTQYFAGGDRFLLSLFTTPQEVAFYSVGATFALIPGVIAGSTIPAIQNASSTTGGYERRRILWSLAATVLVACAIAVFAPWLVTGIFGSEYLPSVTPTRIIELSVLPMALSGLAVALLLGQRRYRSAALISLCAVLASAITITALGDLGAIGASYAVVFSSVVGCLVGATVASRKVVQTSAIP